MGEVRDGGGWQHGTVSRINTLRSDEIASAGHGHEAPQEPFLKFLASLPGASKEVVMKVFPDVQKLLSQGVNAFNQIHGKASDTNEKSQGAAMSTHHFVAEVIAEQMRLESTTPEERAALLQKLQETEDKADKKDSENKAFVTNLLQVASKGVLIALAIAAVVVLGTGTTAKSSDA